MSYSKVIAGGRLKVVVNGSFYGVATGVRWNINEQSEPIVGVDISTPQELAPTVYFVNGQMEVLRLSQDGGLEGKGMAAYSDQILLQKYITIEVLDRVTDNMVARFPRVRVDNQSWGVAAAGVLSGTFTFTSIGFSNEFQGGKTSVSPNIPNGLFPSVDLSTNAMPL